MTRALHIDPFGGFAGDMFLAALLDLGDPAFSLDGLQRFLDATLPGEVRLELADVTRRGLGGKHLQVHVDHVGPLRHPCDLEALIEKSPLTARGRERALLAVGAIADAESRVHRIARDQVHFHEIGAADTIVDLCGAAFALDQLDVGTLTFAPPYLGGGSVQTEHGELPVPAPATAEIMRRFSCRAGVGGERLTPTGAALLTMFGEPASERTWTTDAIGYGAGTREPEHGPANLVRVLSGTGSSTDPGLRMVGELSFQLDDSTGEEIGFLLEGLREAGALDVWTVALGMKKGRPGVGVHALARPEERSRLEQVAFERSPTLGVRWARTERLELARENFFVEVEGRRIGVKRRLRSGGAGQTGDAVSVAATLPGCLGPWDLSPEYEDLASWARESGRSLAELAALTVAQARVSLNKN